MKNPSLTEQKAVIAYRDLYPNTYNCTPTCPVCENNINYGFKFKHCPDCGQLLNWKPYYEKYYGE